MICLLTPSLWFPACSECVVHGQGADGGVGIEADVAAVAVLVVPAERAEVGDEADVVGHAHGYAGSHGERYVGVAVGHAREAEDAVNEAGDDAALEEGVAGVWGDAPRGGSLAGPSLVRGCLAEVEADGQTEAPHVGQHVACLGAEVEAGAAVVGILVLR